MRGLPPTVWALGLVSLTMDVSLEMIHSLLPVILVTTLPASVVSLGIIEGLGEGTAPLMRTVSGATTCCGSATVRPSSSSPAAGLAAAAGLGFARRQPRRAACTP